MVNLFIHYHLKVFINISYIQFMNLDRSIHTTLDQETYNHLKKLQNDHDITLKQAIKMIVDRNKECDKKIGEEDIPRSCKSRCWIIY